MTQIPRHRERAPATEAIHKGNNWAATPLEKRLAMTVGALIRVAFARRPLSNFC